MARQNSFAIGPDAGRSTEGAVGLEYLLLRSTQFDAALAYLPHGLCMFDEARRLILCNFAYAQLYSLPSYLTEPGTPLAAILAYRESIGNAPRDMDTYFDVVHESLALQRYAWARIPLQDGRIIHITHNPMAGGGYVAVHEDVTAHVQAEEKIRHLAAHDSLTGLLNRASFGESVERALAGIRPNEMVAVHFLDLDKFKPVNDTHGHHAGDKLLQAVARRISSCIRDTDAAARLGGDEFAILQIGLTSAAEARRIAARFVASLGAPFHLDDTEITIGASVGTSLAPEDGKSAMQLMKLADAALYDAKRAGRNTHCIHAKRRLA